MGKLNKGLKIILGAGFLILFLIIICNVGVIWNSNNRIYDNPNEIPAHHLGLLLGTSPITTTGIHNRSFDNRIKAATELYKAGKIRKLIVSGGDYTSTEKYGCDEPKAMRDSLIANGVNPDDIFMDYEGLTTIKSLTKLRKYYSFSDTITIISQGYHNQRAIAMADKIGLPAVAFSAEVPPSRFYKIKNYGREALARVKMAGTLYLFPLPDSNSFHSNDKNQFKDFLLTQTNSSPD